MKRISRILLCVFVTLVFSCGGGTPGQGSTMGPSQPPLLQKADLGIIKLQSWYTQSSGLWQTTGWWNAANAVTVLIEYSRLSGSSEYLRAVKNTFSANSSSGFIND